MTGTRFVTDKSVMVYLPYDYKESLRGRLSDRGTGILWLDGDISLERDGSGRVRFWTGDPMVKPIPPSILRLMEEGKIEGVSMKVTFSDAVLGLRRGVWYQAPTGRVKLEYPETALILSNNLEGANAVVEALRFGTPSFVTL